MVCFELTDVPLLVENCCKLLAPGFISVFHAHERQKSPVKLIELGDKLLLATALGGADRPWKAGGDFIEERPRLRGGQRESLSRKMLARRPAASTPTGDS